MSKFKTCLQLSFVLLLLSLSIGCASISDRDQSASTCGAIIDWVDFLKINDITYGRNDEGTKTVKPEHLGKKVGEVSYMLNEHACSNHSSKNGDAAFLPIGTMIYALKGYAPEFRVVADNKVYEASENPKAAVIRDLLDIEGKVDKVSLESGVDGSPIGDFNKKASAEFTQEILPLPYVGYDAVYEKAKNEAGIFLRIHLQDGTSFRMVYYAEANAFSAGAFGTERLRDLIISQRKQIKAAAGL